VRRRGSSPSALSGPAFLVLAGLSSCAESREPAPEPDAALETFVFPAEFEPHRALWMAWPTYENKAGLPTEPLLIEIIRATEGKVAIELLAQDDEEAAAIRERLRTEAAPDGHVTIHSVPHGDVWMRDMGPIFLRGDRGGLRVADFGFNMWGYESPESPNSRLEEAVDRHVAELLGLEVEKSSLISEGGSREFNGEGVMIAVEAVELQRNPGWTLEAMEEEFQRVLGVSKVIWLAEGMAEDELTFRGRLPGGVYTVITTGGHVDEFARFADPGTILLAEITEEERRTDPIAAISHERLEESFSRLSAATDQDGNPFRIVRVPAPDSLFDTMRAGDGVFDYIQPLEYEDGSRIEPGDEITVVAAASYLNFQVTNGIVLAQKYWKPGMPESLRQKDERALAILREVFPGREVLPLDAMAVNLGGGGIHCILQQEPRRLAGREGR
jgi:agmatine deiminase